MGLEAEAKAATTGWPGLVLYATSRNKARAAAKVRGASGRKGKALGAGGGL